MDARVVRLEISAIRPKLQGLTVLTCVGGIQKSRRRERRQKIVQIIWEYCKCVRLLGADARCWWAGAQSERSSLGGQPPTQRAPYSLCCRVFNLSASLLFTHMKLQKRGGVTTLSDPKHDAVWTRTLTWTDSCWRPRRGRSYETLAISLMIFLARSLGFSSPRLIAAASRSWVWKVKIWKNGYHMVPLTLCTLVYHFHGCVHASCTQ